MQISINTSEATTAELTALIALCASLGGRLPSHAIMRETARQAAEIAPDQADDREAPADEQGGPVLADVIAYQQSVVDAPPPPPPAATDSAVDANGIPWDARIHSESKATNADGSWRKRRGVDDAVYAEVLAELSGQTPPPPPAEGNDDTPPPPPSSAPTAVEPSEPAAAAGATVAGKPGAFEAFPAFVSAVSKHGKSYAELNELAGMVGVAAFKDMKDHADKWDAFFAML